MRHFTAVTAFTLAAIASTAAAPTPASEDIMARDCQVKTNTGGLNARCVRWINAGLVSQKRDSVGIANDVNGVKASFHGATMPSVISARDDTNIGVGNDATNSDLDFSGTDFRGMKISARDDTNIGVGNDATNSDLDFSGTDFRGTQIIGKRGDVGILNGASGDYDFDGASFGPIVGSQHVNKRGDVGILNGASGDYNFDDASFGPIIGSQHVNKREAQSLFQGDLILPGSNQNNREGPWKGATNIKKRGDGDVGVKNGATGGGDYSGTTWGPQVGDSYIGYSTVHRRGDGDVGVKNGATGGGDYSGTTWGPQVGDSYIGYSTVHKRDGNNDADPCPGVPVGPSVGTTYMPTHPSTNKKRCSSTPIPPKAGGVVYTKRTVISDQERADAKAGGPEAEAKLKQVAGGRGGQKAADELAAAGFRRDGNNDADPCPGVPVGPSVGTTYMPTHPSTNKKRCSSTPIPPKAGGVVYTRDV